jgi:hypothetical protein
MQGSRKGNSTESKIDGTDQGLDLSCFPLLRVDQLHLHTNNALQKSQEELSTLVDEALSDDQFKGYASRLINLIRVEAAERRVHELLLLSDDDDDDDDDDNNDDNDNNDENDDDRSAPAARILAKDIAHSRSLQVSTKDYAIMKPHLHIRSAIPDHVPSDEKMVSRGFNARARVRTSAIKAKRIMDSDKNQKQLLDKDKLRRRKEAEDRMDERRIRRATIERRLERRRCEKHAREQVQKEKLEELEMELDQVTSAAVQLTEANKGDKTESYINAATAATRVLEQADVGMLSSDSGSSLVSDVDTFAEPVQSPNDGAGEINHELARVEDTYALRDRCVSSCEEIHTSEYDDAKKEVARQTIDQSSIIASEEQTQVFGIKIISRNLSPEASNSYDTTTIKHNTSNRCSADFNPSRAQMRRSSFGKSKCAAEWTPWLKEMNKALTVNAPSLHHDSCRGVYAFTDVFPTFNSIFTAFTSAEDHGVFDRNSRIERECLEYQIKVRSSLKVFAGTTETTSDPSNSLIFCTKSMRKEVASIISDVLLDQDDVAWSEVSESSAGNCWNLLWTWKKPKLNSEHLLVCQRISRFQNTSCLTRKDHLKKRLERMRSSVPSRLQQRWNIMPLTYVLPNEFTAFLSAFSSIQTSGEESQSNLWILKPSAMSRGRGISIVDDIGKVTYSSPSVIQQYLPNPLIFRGYKFDLRLYVLVTSFSPLEAFIYKEGFARFGTRKFSSDKESINDFQIHLTNSSIQNCYIHDIKMNHPARTAGKDGGGNKVRMTWLWSRLKEQGIGVEEIWNQIKDLCIKTLLSAQDEIPSQPNAFEIFGFDVIIDDASKPWLIEVNACPALSRENDLDVKVKEALIEDTIKIVSPSVYNRDALAEICKRRLFTKKRASSKFTSERDVLEHDLRQIFNNELPRQYGQEPSKATGFEPLAPGALFENLVKQKHLKATSQARMR